MYKFELSDKYLSDEEKKVFMNFLYYYNVDECVWEVFNCLFRSGVKGTVAILLKVYEDSKLYGATIIIRCSNYVRSLFNTKFISGIFDFIRIQIYLWIRFNCCMDMMSNPRFVLHRLQH